MDTRSMAQVMHLGEPEVAEAFARGAVLMDAPGFAIHASRRERPGEAEAHAGETDTFYILSGSATLVTGGTVIDPRSEGPGEIRGSGIKGGDALHLSPGEVVVVPSGVPHWFKDVSGPLIYYTVKVRRG